MGLRYEDEPWVRLYKRDDPELLARGWEAQTLFWQLIRKCDRAGIIDLGASGVVGLAQMVHLPVDIVTVGLRRLVTPLRMEAIDEIPSLLPEGEKQPPVAIRGGVLIIVRYKEAQEAVQSGRARQKDYRDRQRDIARARALGILEPGTPTSTPPGTSAPAAAPSQAGKRTRRNAASRRRDAALRIRDATSEPVTAPASAGHDVLLAVADAPASGGSDRDGPSRPRNAASRPRNEASRNRDAADRDVHERADPVAGDPPPPAKRGAGGALSAASAPSPRDVASRPRDAALRIRDAALIPVTSSDSEPEPEPEPESMRERETHARGDRGLVEEGLGAGPKRLQKATPAFPCPNPYEPTERQRARARVLGIDPESAAIAMSGWARSQSVRMPTADAWEARFDLWLEQDARRQVQGGPKPRGGAGEPGGWGFDPEASDAPPVGHDGADDDEDYFDVGPPRLVASGGRT